VIVLHSAAAVDYLLTRTAGAWVEEQLRDADRVHSPHVLDIEVVGAIRKRFQLGDLTVERAEEALLDFRQLRVTRYPHRPFLARMWDLRENVTASDAAFVALAQALALPLITTDLRLARAPGLGIEIRTPDDGV
jgi:predicted nucleic acid-binding protein